MDVGQSPMEKQLCPPLIDAIAEVCDKRPADPIAYIANSLYNHRKQTPLAKPVSKTMSASREHVQQHAGERKNTNVQGSVVNEYTSGVDLPQYPGPVYPGAAGLVTGSNHAKWPIPCYVKLAPLFSVNGRHGGGAALMQISNAYGGPGQDTTSQIFLVRCGFSGNHVSAVSLGQSHAGHFGPQNGLHTDEAGRLYVGAMFGTNHVCLMSNVAEYGSFTHGRLVRANNEGRAVLPINVNGNQPAYGSGCTIVLCSSQGQSVRYNAVYMVRSGIKENYLQATFIKGDDKWKFESDSEGGLTAVGVEDSVIAVYHNRDNVEAEGVGGPAWCGHSQATDGSRPTALFSGTAQCEGAFIVICSTSQGDEDATAASVYLVTVGDGDKVTSTQMVGHAGYDGKHDLWTFSMQGRQLAVTGPADPCRYAVLSNLSPSHHDNSQHTPTCCLATGEAEPMRGAVTVSAESITGWVTKRSDVVVYDNEKLMFTLGEKDLKLTSGKYAFHSKWPTVLSSGLHNIRAYAARRHMTDGSLRQIELANSPHQLTIQPPGVVFSVNCCSQTYEASSGIVYESEFTPFHNVDPDYVFGSRYKPLGCIKSGCSAPELVCNTMDGELYQYQRTPWAEAEDEKRVLYQVDDVAPGKYVLRVNFIGSRIDKLICGGSNLAQAVSQRAVKTKDNYPYLGQQVDVPVTLSGGGLTVDTSVISAFALLRSEYKDRGRDNQALQEEMEERGKLINESEPLPRTLTRKERQIVGWSSNLLHNPSAEKELAGWEMRGDWVTQEGGKGTERAFVTSHMECIKTQKINLLEHFSMEYLDTAPQIQVSEWYKEGVCGGGFYQFIATVLAENGQELAKYDSSKIGTIYRDQRWEQVLQNFEGYGPGARVVSLQSREYLDQAFRDRIIQFNQIRSSPKFYNFITIIVISYFKHKKPLTAVDVNVAGKDDKHWGGHYGPVMSNAVVRVKRESAAATGDTHEDVINQNKGEELLKSQTLAREKLASKLLEDNAEFIQGLEESAGIPGLDQTLNKRGLLSKRVTFRDSKKLMKKREIRLFVSSTFRDFREERENLIKKTFREINGICADRGVFFTYVDLRWGITEEQTCHGQTISICLQEIERCRPYFVCMMGERFGWAQKEGTVDEVLNSSYDYVINNFPKQYGWLEEHRYNNSVTQLEVLHGVLNSPKENNSRSFFYLREPVSPDGMEETKYKVMTAESDWHAKRQTALRDQVLSMKGELNVRDYTNTEQVCAKLKQDLLWCIDTDFPRGTELTPLERENQAHLAFAEQRERVYIGREEYFTQINQYMAEHRRQPLVVLGESGSGKSALVANWTGRLALKEPEAFIFVHFIGSSAESASSIKLMRRLYEELKSFYGFNMAIPTSDSNLARDLGTWLTMAGAKEKCFIILDALNQLDDGAGPGLGTEHDLHWLPQDLPPGVHMLLSTLPGRAYDAVVASNWPAMTVLPLQASEKGEIVSGYLEGIYGKTLSQEQKDMMVNTDRTNNPLYLKALLDEVRMFGSFRLLTKKIEEYLTAETPGELFAKILERLEEDFEKGTHKSAGGIGRPHLVRDTTTAIWCSHRGLAESELLELLQVPSAVWSPFYLSLRENLVNRNGLVNFFHDHLRQAVQNKYLPGDKEIQEGYKKLAVFFDSRPTDDRKVDELPFVLGRCGDLPALGAVLSDLTVFSRLFRTEEGKFDLIKYWKMLGDFNQVVDSYGAALEKVPECERETDDFEKLQQNLAEFYVDLGLFTAARSMFEQVLVRVEKKYKASHGTIICNQGNQARTYRCNHPAVIQLLHNLGEVCERQKDFSQAHEYFRDALSRQNRVTTPTQKLLLTQGLLGQATVYTLQKDSTEAKKYLVRAREIATTVLGPRHHYVAAIINKLGQLCYNQGRLDEALGYFIQDLKLTRGEVGTSHPRAAGILSDIALVYDDKNNSLAGELYEATLIILLHTYGKQHIDVATTRYNLGCFYFATSYFSRAKYQFTEAVRIYEAFLGSDHPDTLEARSALSDVTGFC